jgi:CheY-like chemotaxis protein
MHDRGSLVLTTENYRCDKSSGQYFRIPPGQYTRLSVSDSGTGISTEILPHVFEPFFTTKSTDKSRGSGLGLSIVQAVMEDHGGYVDLESEEGIGTKFSLYFPPTDSVEGIKDSTNISGGNEIILVVDDDAQQRKVTEMLLEKLGYRVKTAANGEVALRIIKHHKPDLLILDMILQDDLDGAEIFKKARQIYPDIKAIIVSGYAESARVAAAKVLGAGQFLKKPLTIKSLAKAVRCELDKSYQTETAN